MLARIRARIEAAAPAPRGLVVRDAGPDGDEADMDVAVIDQPALFASVVVAAAGECGHPAIKAQAGAAGKSAMDWVWGCGMATAARVLIRSANPAARREAMQSAREILAAAIRGGQAKVPDARYGAFGRGFAGGIEKIGPRIRTFIRPSSAFAFPNDGACGPD